MAFDVVGNMVEARKLVVGVVILAAGASTRMGRPKMLLPWGGTSVVGHLIGLWQELGAQQVVVVCAAGDAALETELDRLGLAPGGRIINPEPQRGMFSSLQCASRWPGWNTELTHWIIALGDQPHLRKATLRALLECSGAHPEGICQPSFQQRPKHPVCLPGTIFRSLGHSTADNLKQFKQKYNSDLYVCESADAGLALDMDWPADYTKALEHYFGQT